MRGLRGSGPRRCRCRCWSASARRSRSAARRACSPAARRRPARPPDRLLDRTPCPRSNAAKARAVSPAGSAVRVRGPAVGPLSDRAGGDGRTALVGHQRDDRREVLVRPDRMHRGTAEQRDVVRQLYVAERSRPQRTGRVVGEGGQARPVQGGVATADERVSAVPPAGAITLVAKRWSGGSALSTSNGRACQYSFKFSVKYGKMALIEVFLHAIKNIS